MNSVPTFIKSLVISRDHKTAMSLNEITFLKSLDPITFLNTPSKETIEMLAKFIQHPLFSKFVEVTRQQYKIPNEGINIKQFAGKNFSELPYINNEFVLPVLHILVKPLAQELGMSDDFLPQIMLLVFFHAFIDVKYFDAFISHPIKFILRKKNIAATMYDYPFEVGAILIPYNVSQNMLMKWIRQHWEEITKQMEEELSDDPYIIRMNKNTEYALEITDLRINKKLSFAKIADKLSRKYPNDERFTSEIWVKKVYYDYQATLNSLNIQPKDK